MARTLSASASCRAASISTVSQTGCPAKRRRAALGWAMNRPILLATRRLIARVGLDQLIVPSGSCGGRSQTLLLASRARAARAGPASADRGGWTSG